MNGEANDIAVLTSVTTEAEAEMIVAMLEREGIEARTTGALTAGFRAEAPGWVQVVVRSADLQRAGELLAAVRRQSEPP